jgi:transcriptional regulator with XRE-family HTH domain
MNEEDDIIDLNKVNLTSVGARLRKLRRAKDLTQQNIADILEFKKVSGYQKYENGTVTPPAEKLAKLAELFGVTTDFLLGREVILTPDDITLAHDVASSAAARDVRKAVEEIIQETGTNWPRLGRLKTLLESFRNEK